MNHVLRPDSPTRLPQDPGGTVTYYAQCPKFSKSPCKLWEYSSPPVISKARAGHALDDFQDGGEVLLAEAPPDPHGVELSGERREGEARADRPRLVEAQADVLEHVLELEQRAEVVLEHRPSLELEHRRVRRARAHDLEQRVEVDAGLPAHHERLREHRAVGRAHRVRDHLHGLTLADFAGVDD